MTVFIKGKRMTESALKEAIYNLGDHGPQIVRAWHKSEIPHCFDKKERFTKAVERNIQTLTNEIEFDEPSLRAIIFSAQKHAAG